MSQSWSSRSLARSLRWVLLLLISASELALLSWALLASGGPALGISGSLAGFAGMLGFNTVWTLAARRSRRLRRSFVFGRGYLLLSFSALASGGVLIGLYAAVSGLAAVLPGLASDQWILLGGAGASAGGLAVVLYSVTLGQRRITTERLTVPIRALDPRLEGLTIAHVTDLHIGPNLRAPQLRRFVDRINATRPDLIAITGDIFDFDPSYIEEGCRELSKLWAPHGVLAVLGNHDVYTGVRRVALGIAKLTSIRLLRDELVRLEIDGARLGVAGIDDPGRGLSDRDIESPSLARLRRDLGDDAGVLLVHRPNYFGQIARLGFPLALAGHTHGGQVSLPSPVSQWNVARLLTPWTRGLFRLRESHLYVSRGLGVGGVAMRLNCPREIALLTLARAPERDRAKC